METLSRICPCCGSIMTGDVQGYPHDYGWMVIGAKGKWWLSLHCGHCNYDASLNKLGVPRSAAFDEPVEFENL